MSKPIVLGGTAGTNRETSHACHEAMELRTGDVIAVLSSTVNIAAERQRERGILGVLLAAGLVVTIGGVVALRQALVRLVTGPVGAITGQVGRLAEGQLDIAVTVDGAAGRVGIMARAFGHLRDSQVARATWKPGRGKRPRPRRGAPKRSPRWCAISRA